MRLLITDVTQMHGGNFCVAGWDQQAQRMIRPLPNGQNWTAGRLQQYQVVPGAQIEVQPLGVAHHGSYPHSTEDTPIAANDIELLAPGPFNWFAPNAPTTSPNLQVAFGGMLQHNSQWNGVLQGLYVSPGTHVPSLVALNLPRGSILFTEDFGKLKAVLNDGQHSYKLAVSSDAIKSAWQQSQ